MLKAANSYSELELVLDNQLNCTVNPRVHPLIPATPSFCAGVGRGTAAVWLDDMPVSSQIAVVWDYCHWESGEKDGVCVCMLGEQKAGDHRDSELRLQS